MKGVSGRMGFRVIESVYHVYVGEFGNSSVLRREEEREGGRESIKQYSYKNQDCIV